MISLLLTKENRIYSNICKIFLHIISNLKNLIAARQNCGESLSLYHLTIIVSLA